MSYQIKSTPFFRRMFNTSKKNGQLQRLREEYERIQEFNDRTIEMKMRQVRLKRLFREIEEIKDMQPTGSKRRRQGGATQHSLQDRTPQNERIEALARAKELGKEMSRRNAVETAAANVGISRAIVANHRRFGGHCIQPTKTLAAAEARRQATERRERTARRINYGNAQSKCNMQKIGQRRQRNQQSSTSIDGSSDAAGNEKRTKLLQRLAYGNARSTCNMARTSAALRRGNNHVKLPVLCRLEDAAATEVKMSQTVFSDVLEEQPIVSTTSLISSEEQQEDQQLTSVDALDPLELRRKKNFLLNLESSSTPVMHKFAIINGSENSAQAHWRRISNTLPWFKVFGRNQNEENDASVTVMESSCAEVPICSSQSAAIDGNEMHPMVDASSSYEDIRSTTVLDTSDTHAWQRSKQHEQATCHEATHMAAAEAESRCLLGMLETCQDNA